MLHYYAMRKSIKNGTPQTINSRFGEYAEMLRQYFLYCASAATNADGNDYDFIEFGTIEQGAIKTERFDNAVTEETPEAE